MRHAHVFLTKILVFLFLFVFLSYYADRIKTTSRDCLCVRIVIYFGVSFAIILRVCAPRSFHYRRIIFIFFKKPTDVDSEKRLRRKIHTVWPQTTEMTMRRRLIRAASQSNAAIRVRARCNSDSSLEEMTKLETMRIFISYNTKK